MSEDWPEFKSGTAMMAYADAVEKMEKLKIDAAKFLVLLDSVREVIIKIYSAEYAGPNDCSDEPVRIATALTKIIAEAEMETE